MFLAWSDEDQGKALAWAIEQKGRCQTCGTYHWQWPHEGQDGMIADGYICYGCEQLDLENDRRKDDVPHPGLKIGLFPPGDKSDPGLGEEDGR